MTTQFNSFNASALGAFRQSTLKARGGGRAGPFFIEDSAGDYRTSPNPAGVFTNNLGAHDGPVTVLGSKVFNKDSLLVSPYSSFSSYTGATSLRSHVVQSAISGKYISIHTTSGSNRRIFTSSDGIAWTSITHPNTATGGAFAFDNVGTASPIITPSGRILCFGIALSAPSTRNFYAIYSDDGGATWVGGANENNATGAFIGPGNTSEVRLWNTLSNTIHVQRLAANAAVGVSSDDGATWSLQTNTSVPSGVSGARWLARVATGTYAGRIYGFCPRNVASTNDGLLIIDNDGAASSDFTTAADYGCGMVMPDGTLYCYNATDSLLYTSVDGVTFTAVTTNPTPLTCSSDFIRIVGIGMAVQD